MVRKYLATFVFPNVDKRELADLGNDVKMYVGLVSGEDSQIAFITSGAIGYLFTSSSPASEIAQKLKLPSSIKWLIVEVGESFSHHGLPNTGKWLWDRRTQR